MQVKGRNALAKIDRPRGNKPLVAAAAAVVILGIIAAVMAARDADWPLAVLSLAIALAGGLVILFYLARENRRNASLDRGLIQWDTALPEIQRQNVNLEVRELARHLNLGREQFPDLLSAYIVAEDLALREIQQEEKLPMLRHVEIGNTPFDAILIEESAITCIDVTFLVAPDLRQDKIDAVMKKVSAVTKTIHDLKLRLGVKLLFVVVTQLSEEETEQLAANLTTDRFSNPPYSFQVVPLDFEKLQRTYISE